MHNWYKSEVPDTSNLDGAQELRDIASSSMEDKDLKYKRVNLCPADSKAVDDKFVTMGVLGDFPPGKQNIHFNGILAGEGGSIPQNSTVKTFTRGFIDITDTEYNTHSSRTIPIFMNSFVWGNVLPYDLEYNIIKEDPDLYNAFIARSKPHVVKYIQALMRKYPNIKVWIVLGGPAYKFVVDTGVIPPEMLVQDGPVVHTSKLSRPKGAWISEVIDFNECINRTIARLLNEECPKPVQLLNVRNIFNVRENHAYDAKFDGVTVISASTIDNLIELIRGEGVKVNLHQGSGEDFPIMDEIIAGGAEYKDLTLEARHYTQPELVKS